MTTEGEDTPGFTWTHIIAVMQKTLRVSIRRLSSDGIPTRSDLAPDNNVVVFSRTRHRFLRTADSGPSTIAILSSAPFRYGAEGLRSAAGQ
ncbi:hypothetical protein [Albidovulum sp.]|uniref:hypothetical protein n=1 Tax=Albidovulum sp. TaxID=1872424 RepID=UPI0039B83687